MNTNMGTIDRALRIVIAVSIGVMYATGVIGGTWAAVLGIVAVAFIFTGAVSFCPLYRIVGLSTCPVEPSK